jgi:hypothetical protein
VYCSWSSTALFQQKYCNTQVKKMAACPVETGDLKTSYSWMINCCHPNLNMAPELTVPWDLKSPFLGKTG